MKSLHALLFLLVMGFAMTSCDNGNAKVSTDTTAKETTNQANNKAQPAPESRNLEEKRSAAGQSSSGGVTFGDGNGMVEKTERVKAAPVDDAGVDYSKIAQAVCDCGSEYFGKDEQTGDVLVTKDDTKYKEVVDCSMKKKNKITNKNLNRQTMVRAIKKACSSIPPTLVMSFIIA